MHISFNSRTFSNIKAATRKVKAGKAQHKPVLFWSRVWWDDIRLKNQFDRNDRRQVLYFSASQFAHVVSLFFFACFCILSTFIFILNNIQHSALCTGYWVSGCCLLIGEMRELKSYLFLICCMKSFIWVDCGSLKIYYLHTRKNHRRTCRLWTLLNRDIIQRTFPWMTHKRSK